MTTFRPRKATTERVDFKNARGHRLAGLLERPASASRLFALVAHCFTCSKDFPAIAHISRALSAKGIGVLRFDFTGLGGSQGSFAETSFSTTVDDLLAAAKFLKERERAPALLVGHSWGGAACLAAAEHLEPVRAVATIAAPSSPAHVLEHFPREVQTALEHGQAPIAVAGRSYPLTRGFIEDLDPEGFQERLRRFDRGLLVLHSPVDEVVAIEHAERIYRAVRGPRSFVSLPGADHVLSGRADAEYVASMISTWVERYVPTQLPINPGRG